MLKEQASKQLYDDDDDDGNNSDSFMSATLPGRVLRS
jgi:hypothetical protein